MAERLSPWDGIRGFFVALASLGSGAILLVGPEEIRKEIPDDARTRWGFGFLIFGAVFCAMLVFAARSKPRSQEIASRLKALMLVVCCGALLALLSLTFGRGVFAAFRLHRDGTHAQAVVLERRIIPAKGATKLVYAVRYDGHRATLRLPGSARVGESVSVMYLRDHPDIVLAGQPGDSFSTLLEREVDKTTCLLAAGMGLACIAWIAGGLKRLLLGEK